MNNVITEIFCFVDEFCKIFQQELEKKSLPNQKSKRKPTREPGLSIAEIATILILYSFSPCKNFKFYYLNCVKKEDFPGLVSYNRFIELQPRAFKVITALADACKGRETGHYFIDATMIPVCHNKRIYGNKVFKNKAATGKSTMGWFFGFKLHLVINERGEIMNLALTKANEPDISMLEILAQNLCGRIYGDKGYICSKRFKKLLEKGLKLVTGVKKNMKNQLMEMKDKLMLRKRSLVETVFDILKNKLGLSLPDIVRRLIF